ncbi:MAG: glycosyltransferase family 4 protein [Candidatus Bathyarchaeia archaeon]
MNIVIIHPHLSIMGGGERLTKILAVGLEKVGVDVYILTSTFKGGFPEFSNLRTVLFESKGAGSLQSNLVTMYLAVKSAVESFSPDAVISMTEDTVTLGFSKVVRERLKTIQYVHFPYEEEAAGLEATYLKYYRFPGWFNRLFLWSADRLACNSKYTQETVRKVWGRIAKVVYPAVDYIFEDKPGNLGSTREKIILCTGRFTRLKRQDFLVRSFPKIKERVKDAKLILAGYRDERHKHFLDTLLNQDVGDVEFHINPTDEELIQLYREAKVYCHPRIGEHFGMTPIEAMSQGVPVIAYDSGGVRETMLNGKTGYLVVGDEEFVDMTIRLLEMDLEDWRKMQAYCVERAEQFRPEHFINEFMSLMAG